MGVKINRKIMFGNYGEYISLILSMFVMYIFVAIIVLYNILVALQMITFFNNLCCFDLC